MTDYIPFHKTIFIKIKNRYRVDINYSYRENMAVDDVIKRLDEIGCMFTAESIGKYQYSFIPFAKDRGLIRWLYWEMGCMNCYQYITLKKLVN